jgi:hypothetical protein
MPRRGFRQSEEQRERISAGLRRAYREGRSKVDWVHRLPLEYQRLAIELGRKISNASYLRRILEDHIAVVERRKRLANGSP